MATQFMYDLLLDVLPKNDYFAQTFRDLYTGKMVEQCNNIIIKTIFHIFHIRVIYYTYPFHLHLSELYLKQISLIIILYIIHMENIMH